MDRKEGPAQSGKPARRGAAGDTGIPAAPAVPGLGLALLRLALARAAILLVGLNLAQPLGLIPEKVGPVDFAPFFNILSVALTGTYLALAWSGRLLKFQLRLQVSVDLWLVTFLVAVTGGIGSPFASFYLLIIVYCGLTLGRKGGLTGAALSTILYAGIALFEQLGAVNPGAAPPGAMPLAFLVSLHSIGFFAVAFLGSHLSQRLHTVEAELERNMDSLERLRHVNEHVVQSIRSGLITTDLRGLITVFNSTAAELTGKEGGEMLGRPVESVIGAPLWSQVSAADFFRDLRPLRHEDWIATPDGRRRFFGFSVSPLHDQERSLLGYIVSFQDLTEIKQLEEELRRRDRMAAIGRMAAAIAHEIRNPLTAMRGSVEILRAHANLPATDRRLLEILIRESDRLNRFIEDFLQFARPGGHSKSIVDVVGLLRDSVTLLKNSADVRGKHVIAFDADTPELAVLGSDHQLRQVFWNLSQNALRAMPAGGRLSIRTYEAAEGMCRIEFADEGVGMTPEEQRSLFQPFQSGFHGGTGLGLSIVLQIVEDHGGTIGIESEKGRGTLVTISLPAEATPRAVAQSQ